MITPWKGRGGKRVAGSGPRDARVVLLAEAPGGDEETAGVPLIGKSGSFLFEGAPDVSKHVWPGIGALGLGRDVVRCENVLEVRPLDNELDTVSLASMAKWQGEARKRLESLPEFDLLVPMGNCALNTVLGSPLKQQKKKAGGAEWVWPHSISAWRGSVNEVRIGGWRGRTVKMIPTFHPAFFLYGGGANFAAWRGDWARIAAAARDGIDVWPKLNTIVGPTWRQVELFEKLVQHTWHREGKGALLTLDIETIGPIIDCIGFCVDGETTLTLPLLPQLWPAGREDVKRAWATIRRLVEHDIPKGTHWGYYDVFRLERQKGWRVRRWWWDSYNLHHLLDPADEHRLAYCASRDLAVPYWKHLGKEDKRGIDKELKANWEKRHRYNGYDVGYTWALIREYQRRLAGEWEGLWPGIAA